MYIIFIIPPSVDDHLGWLQPLAVRNRAAINMDAQVPLWWIRTCSPTCLRVVSLSHTLAIERPPHWFPSNCTSDCEQGSSFLMSLPAYFWLFVFLIIASLTRVRWNFQIVSICTSLMAEDVEYLKNVYWPFAVLLWRINSQAVQCQSCRTSVFPRCFSLRARMVTFVTFCLSHP